ncbi:MAG: WbqC family protein [Calditrichaceae bacterium]|jgi:hypothetical protein
MNKFQDIKNFSTIRPEYLPSIGYFWNLGQCKKIVLTDHFQYSKRQAFSISPPLIQNDVVLRIPVKHDPAFMPLYKKQIFHNDWINKHFATIKHKYQNFPFAYLYLPEINNLYSANIKFLSDFLTKLISVISKWLYLDTEIYQASKIGFSKDNDQCVISWAEQLNCGHYINSKYVFQNAYINKQKLTDNNIIVDEFNPLPDFNIFQSYKNMCIFSFLFQFGPEAGYIIKQFQPITGNSLS